MKKSLWILFFLILIIGIVIFGFNSNKNNEEDSYIAERTTTETKNNLENKSNNTIESNYKEKEEDMEEIIAEFSTKLPNDTKARDNNIKLACKIINGAVVNAGDTFSFWNILGGPTKEGGYEKAKTFTSDGEVTESYGGGVCQISTTIYNAVLKVKGLKVTERHKHSRDVPYIKDGKDAAVSYNSADLKFKNNLDYDIKIEAKVEDRNVKIKLIRI